MTNDIQMAICRSTGAEITEVEMKHREAMKYDLVTRLHQQLGKTRKQVIELFRFYNKAAKTKILPPAVVR
jgi:hypothetical protein